MTHLDGFADGTKKQTIIITIINIIIIIIIFSHTLWPI